MAAGGSIGVLFGILERGDDGYVYFTRMRVNCPYCSGRMKMYSAFRGVADHTVICDRNPERHRGVFDMTTLVDVAEEWRNSAAVKGT